MKKYQITAIRVIKSRDKEKALKFLKRVASYRYQIDLENVDLFLVNSILREIVLEVKALNFEYFFWDLLQDEYQNKKVIEVIYELLFNYIRYCDSSKVLDRKKPKNGKKS